MLRYILSRACPSLLRLQPWQGNALYSVQIEVPALGDSISDGGSVFWALSTFGASMCVQLAFSQHFGCSCNNLCQPPRQQATLHDSRQSCHNAAGAGAGTIATVLKKSGDEVAENETIAQVETDKVTIDIKAPSEGTLLGIVVQEQDTVVPGQLVATLDDSAAKVC